MARICSSYHARGLRQEVSSVQRNMGYQVPSCNVFLTNIFYRQRVWSDSAAGLKYSIELAQSLVDKLGNRDLAAWIAFSVEREYWEQRNWAGKVQKGLQDKLGLGWLNHDHHTFRSSRNVFTLLIKFLETFGFFRRERHAYFKS